MPRSCLLRILLLVLLLEAAAVAQVGRLPRPAFALQSGVEGGSAVRLSWSEPDGPPPQRRKLLRSTTDLRTTLDSRAFPIAALEVERANAYLDSAPPQGVELFYRVKLVYPDGRAVYSTVASIALKAPPLSRLQRPHLLIDKAALVLTVFDGETAWRRFPIALGANPVVRKLHQDRASTPEGRYQISGVQPRATYYKAYDLDYPNAVDRARYGVLGASGGLPNPRPSIGGEIQIHGRGITSHWTWGCIALRDGDMDILFSRPEIALGAPVTVVGWELELADLECERALSREQKQRVTEHLVASRLASGRSGDDWSSGLCKLQSRNGLTVTGMFDRATRRLLEREGVL